MTYRHRALLLTLIVVASALLPGIAHLRFSATRDGVAYLGVCGVLSFFQFAPPLLEAPAHAAATCSVAFVLGWVISALTARSAARLTLAEA